MEQVPGSFHVLCPRPLSTLCPREADPVLLDPPGSANGEAPVASETLIRPPLGWGMGSLGLAMSPD